MAKLYNCGKLELKTSTIPKAGFGVFATNDIKAGEILEECQYLQYPKYITEFKTYRFWLDAKKRKYALVLGYGSIYNSDEKNQNAYWCVPSTPKIFTMRNVKITRKYLDCFTFYALKDIKKGEEIFTYYGYKVRI